VGHGPRNEPYRFRDEPAIREGQHLARCAVEPLGVVDNAEQGLLTRNLGQQTEYGQAHQANGSGAVSSLSPSAVSNASRWGTGSRSMRSGIRADNWCRPANGSSSSDTTPVACAIRNGRLGREVLQRLRLADSGLAAHDQRTAASCSEVATQPIERLALATAVQQHIASRTHPVVGMTVEWPESPGQPAQGVP
jgi:hypothetical protein